MRKHGFVSPQRDGEGRLLALCRSKERRLVLPFEDQVTSPPFEDVRAFLLDLRVEAKNTLEAFGTAAERVLEVFKLDPDVEARGLILLPTSRPEHGRDSTLVRQGPGKTAALP